MNRVRNKTLAVLTMLATVIGGPGEQVQGGTNHQPKLQRYQFAELHMGVQFTLTFYAENEETAIKAGQAAFQRIQQLNGLLSDYDPLSELSRLSTGSPHERGIAVSADLWHVLAAAQQISRSSEGAFDVTVGPLTRLWRRSRRQGELPPQERLAPALAAVGYQHIQLDMKAKTVRLAKPGMRLDLGGIAKGYAADEALKILATHGITRALVDGSGDVALGDPPPGEVGWKVGVAPLQPDGPPSMHLCVANCAVATSGDAWQHVVIAGVRYSHIVNPKTGLGLTHQGGVTVVAPNCLLADALASTVSVLGAERGIAFAEEQPDVEAMFVSQLPGGEIERRTTKGFVATSAAPDAD